jgi:hypothetical protein
VTLLARFAPVLASAGLVLSAFPAFAGPTIGFVEHWSTPGSTSGWYSQAENTNPGTGGADGVADGFLRVARSGGLPLSSHSNGLEFYGDWLAANVNRIRLRLNDVDANQAFEVHVGIGNSGNFWLYKPGFIPPEHAWAQFTVDLSDSSQFEHIISWDYLGFAGALQNVDRVLVRHDLAPYIQQPDPIDGELGIDDFELANSVVGVPGPAGVAARPVELAAPYPNPARGAVACAFDTFDGAAVRVLILDAAGRIVRAESLPAGAPGRRLWMWDGRDDRGLAAAPGNYRVRAVGPAGGTSRPFVLAR